MDVIPTVVYGFDVSFCEAQCSQNSHFVDGYDDPQFLQLKEAQAQGSQYRLVAQPTKIPCKRGYMLPLCIVLWSEKRTITIAF